MTRAAPESTSPSPGISAATAVGEVAPARPSLDRLRALSLIAHYARPYRTRLVVFTIALFVGAATFLVLGQGLKLAVDKGFAAGDPRGLDRALAFLLVVVVISSVSSFIRFYLISWLGERIVADVRKAVFSRVLTLSPSWFESARTGEMVSRLTTDTALIEQVVGTSVSMALRQGLMGIGALVMLAITSVKLTALVLMLVPLVMGPIVLFGRRVRKLSRASQDRVADLGVQIDETLHEIRTVQAYGHEAEDRRAFGERIEAAFETARRRIGMRAGLVSAVILLVFGGIGVILWIGGHDVMAGRITPGELSAFVFYAAMVAAAAGAVSEVVGDLQRGAGAAERLAEILGTVPDIAAPAVPMALPEPPIGRVEFDEVRFSYPSRPTPPALAGLTLRVEPGERVALVGPSGAGKSTVFQLLLRFYDPQSGVVRLDGLDLKRADPAAVRNRIALVPQEPAIFATSVRENVRYGRPEAGDADVEAACEAAFAKAFVHELPERYDTFLGERGVRLSGGQRQRLAIARAILADRPVLLLDEATSALDAESERMVQLALETLMRGRTSLVIAHRLATVKTADRIAVIDGGRLVGVGTHDELLASNPLYARLAKLQFGA